MANVKVEVTVVPTQGKSSSKTVKVGAKGTQLRDVLKAAGVSADNKDLTVNGKPATLDTYVGAKDKVKAAAVKLQVSERPAGS